MEQQANGQLIKHERLTDQCVQSPSQCHIKQETEQQTAQNRAGGLQQLQQISHNLATDLYNVSDHKTTTNIHNVSDYHSVRNIYYLEPPYKKECCI